MSDWEETADLIIEGINSSVLSESVMYQKKNSLESFEVYGVFSLQYVGVSASSGDMFVGKRAGLTVRDADIPDGPETGDKVTARNVRYRIDKIEVDGQSAGTALILKKIN